MTTSVEPTGDKQPTVEERFSAVGARIDELICKATQVKEKVVHDITDTKDVSCSALDELKSAMDSAWMDMNIAWDEIKAGTERAKKKLNREQ